ncbi:haloacid dehalogenase-like hydrolase [Bifidobacterium myosotis]|uniref:Haloacid dehalogenase-like hydrolase n=1 Tax=Bifidobacterium myosotis TaxID=1630166 RepID=A0A261FIM0_9BIFI|nr:HAD family hydrolase [Bifidobacterium myosotis]OZG58979.1 haloacid dehalogenase-like hydrolase [Bifidobacterium myosotis]
MQRYQRYDAVFFDLYGTLVDIRTDESSDAAWEALSEALTTQCGVSYPDTESLRSRFDELAAPIRAAVVARHGEWAEPDLLPVYRGLAHDSGDGQVARVLAWTFRRASTSLLRLYPGAQAMLARLRTAGLRIVLVSNAQSCYTRPELDLLGLITAFDRIVISSEAGVRKPSPELFRRALEAGQLDPSRVVMVGNDERADVLGARAAGMDGVYLRTAISPPDDPAASAHAVCSLAGPDYASLMRYLGIPAGLRAGRAAEGRPAGLSGGLTDGAAERPTVESSEE